MFGLAAEAPVGASSDVFYLWPDNLPAWRLFTACSTQWRSGMGGREGLDYTGVQVVMALHRVRQRRRRELFALVQAMESAALKAWADKQAEQTP